MDNLINTLKMLKNNGLNPKNFIMQQIGNSNPIFTQLFKMANANDTKGIENFARNLLKERGKDFDKEFNEFMKKIG